MDRPETPKLITREVIETVLSNKKDLKSLFHLEDEEGYVDGSCKVSWNPKMLKFVLCDVQIHAVTKSSEEEYNSQKDANDGSQIYINVSDLPNRIKIEALEEEVKQLKKTVAAMKNEFENIKDRYGKLSSAVPNIYSGSAWYKI